VDQNNDLKRKCEDQNDQKNYLIEAEKEEIEKKLRDELEADRKEFQESLASEGVAAVRQQIQEARRKVYQSESTQRKIQRELQQLDQDIGYIRGDIRQVQRSNQDQARQMQEEQDRMESQLERELREKDAELKDIHKKIASRREALAKGTPVEGESRAQQLLDKAQDMKYSYL
jgi:chromosome segregation ATPase